MTRVPKGEEVQYTCGHGRYPVTGSGVTQCLGENKWTAPTLVCKGELGFLDMYIANPLGFPCVGSNPILVVRKNVVSSIS